MMSVKAVAKVAPNAGGSTTPQFSTRNRTASGEVKMLGDLKASSMFWSQKLACKMRYPMNVIRVRDFLVMRCVRDFLVVRLCHELTTRLQTGRTPLQPTAQEQRARRGVGSGDGRRHVLQSPVVGVAPPGPQL